MKNRLYFLWDYDLSEADVKRLLKTGNETTRRWLMARILESAKYQDVWKYLSLPQVAEGFPRLRLKEPIRRAWQRALEVWGVL